MKSLFPFFTIFFLTVAGILLFGCGGGDDDDGQPAANEDYVTDQSTGLSWQKFDQTQVDWADADEYCANLELGNYKDWRLPTITELRSLVRGCDITETGGECAVTDECAATDCWTATGCDGCTTKEGPGPEGRYQTGALSGDGWVYWSATATANNAGNTAWGISFDTAAIHGFGVNDDGLSVRCVR